MRTLSVGVLSCFCNILDNVKSHIVKTTIKILSQTPIMNLSLHFLCLALSTCLSKLSSLKCVDSVTNAVICKLHPTGYKMNAVRRAHCILIAEPLKVFQPCSPKTVCRLFGWWINIHHMIAITSTIICNFRCFTK